MPRPRHPVSVRLAAVPHRPWYPAVSAGVLAAVAVAEIDANRITSPAAVITVGAAVMPLPWRCRWPWLAACVTVAALLNFLFRPQLLLATALAGMTGLYVCARRRLLHPAALAGCAIAGAVLVNLGHLWMGVYDLGGSRPALGSDGSLSYFPSFFAESLLLSCGITATVVIADAARSREEYRREREAAQKRLVEMERGQAVAAERARIARELHDIVAHAVSVIAIQAEANTYTIPHLSERARDGFQSIAGSARASLAELRSLVDVLRQENDTAATTTPQPTLDDLSALLDAHRAVGGTVELHTTGARPRTRAAVELAAYRIVQEALTNVRRHAAGAHAICRIDYAPEHIRVHVANTAPLSLPPPRAPGSGGHGLDGMHERAALLGGNLDWHPTPDGGFTVIALLPTAAPGNAVHDPRPA